MNTDPRKNVWAPWRLEYIETIGTGPKECFLCRAARNAADDEANLVLWRSARVLVLLNRYPYASGHLLVAPVQHEAEPENLSDDVLLEITQRTRDAKRALQQALRAQGFNIGMNLGHCAGAGVPDHLHQHVVPRWNGDTNFMAVLGDVTVIPASLAAMRTRFLAAARELGLPPSH